MTISMGKAHSQLQRASTLATFSMGFSMDTANFTGRMAASTVAITAGASKMAMVNSLTQSTIPFAEEYGPEECFKEMESTFSREVQ